ncbi:MAG: AtpZ/AtpI family protein [Firmicutes bacterium]|nr:AtpZ/AtpI family protein [Ezakiella sp.]MDD7761939.1 AtpZ/AtpI family protein [Bacillota bacterium]
MKNFKYLALVGQLGLDIIVSALFWGFIGYLIDRLLKIDSSIFTIILGTLGLIGGFGAGFHRLFMQANIKNNKEREQKDE